MRICLVMRLMVLQCYLRNTESLSSRSGFSRGRFHVRGWNLHSAVMMSILESRKTVGSFDKCYRGLNVTVCFAFQNLISGAHPSMYVEHRRTGPSCLFQLAFQRWRGIFHTPNFLSLRSRRLINLARRERNRKGLRKIGSRGRRWAEPRKRLQSIPFYRTPPSIPRSLGAPTVTSFWRVPSMGLIKFAKTNSTRKEPFNYRVCHCWFKKNEVWKIEVHNGGASD